MGTLKYDGSSVDFDDRVLAHLEVVIVQKLRRQESFLMTWQDSEESGNGRTGIWINPMSILTFHFVSSERAQIDRVWLERLMVSANSTMGLFVADVDGDVVHPSSEHLTP